MGIKGKQLRHDKLKKDLTNFFNFMCTNDIDPLDLDAATLWELKDISDVNTRYDD